MTDSNSIPNKDRICMNCKFFAQGEGCGYCASPDASKDEKGYRYYNFSCDEVVKFENGTHESRLKLNK